MSNSNKKSIPAWQKSITVHDSKDVPSEGAAAVEPGETSKSADVLEQARKFLEDPSIKDAPKEKKLAFLNSKGLRKEDVESLLDASSASSTEDTPQQPKTVAQSTETPKSNEPHDIPPVITYPEFLIHANKPPPLVTTSFLLNTAYLASGLATSMWGLSRYIIEPMQANLSHSRHDFFTHASSQLEDLNNKLSGVVSNIPSSRPTTSHREGGLETASEKSDDSDPTELYHHDIGTQTSPRLLSHRSSLASSTTDSSSTDNIPVQQEDRLRTLSSHLKDLQSSSRHASDSEATIDTQLTDLKSYLSDMQVTNAYIKNNTFGGYGAGWGAYGSAGGTTTGGKSESNDEIDKFMKDIRGVKGVLLSARNFPRAGAGTAYGAG